MIALRQLEYFLGKGDTIHNCTNARDINWDAGLLYLNLTLYHVNSGPVVLFRSIARDPGLFPGLGRSPGEGNDCQLQYSYLENSTDRGVWWATAHGTTLALNNIPLSKGTSLSIHLLKDMVVASNLEIMNKAAKNIYLQVFMWT